MNDFVNSVTEAQKQLKAAMRRDTDMRWSLLPVEPITPRRRYWLLAIPIGVVVLISLARWVM